MKFVDFMADSRDFYTGLIDPVCKKYGLTQMEFNILLFLANNPECDTTLDKYSQNLIIIKMGKYFEAGQMSHVPHEKEKGSVRSLEERGLLTGEYYGTDRRTIHLKLMDSLLRRWSLMEKTSRNGLLRSSAADSPRKSTGCCSNL